MDGSAEISGGMLSVWGGRLIAGALTLVLGWIVSSVVSRGCGRAMRAAYVDETLATFCGTLVHITLVALVVITALHQFGVPAISFAAVVGAAGLAVGLALKGTLSNLASGVILIAMRPFAVGDRIQAAGVSGVVREIAVFATTVEGGEGERIMIPNATLAAGIITRFGGGASGST